MADITGLPQTDEELALLQAGGVLTPDVVTAIKSRRAPPTDAETQDALNRLEAMSAGPAAAPNADWNTAVMAGDIDLPDIGVQNPVNPTNLGVSGFPGLKPPQTSITPEDRGEPSSPIPSADTTGTPRVTSSPGAVGVAPPRLTTTTETQTARHGIAPDAEKRLIDAGNKAAAATADKIKAEAEYSTILANQQKAANETSARLLNEHANQLATEQDALAAEQQKVNDAIAEYQGYRLDSGRWFANQGLAGKAFAVLGLLAGAMGQAMGGPENPAIKILNDAIERDIRLQEHELSQKRGNVELRNTVYNQMRGRFQDAQQARLVTHAATLERMKGQLEELRLRTPDKMVQASIANAQAQLDLEMADKLAKANTYTTTTVSKQATAGTPGKLEAGVVDKQAEFETSIKETDRLIKEAERLRDKVGPIKGRLNDVLKKIGEDDPEVSTFASDLKMAAYANAHRWFGALSNSDKVTAVENFAGTQMSPETLIAFLKNQRQKDATAYQTYLKTASGEPGQPGFAVRAPSVGNSDVGFKPAKGK